MSAGQNSDVTFRPSGRHPFGMDRVSISSTAFPMVTDTASLIIDNITKSKHMAYGTLDKLRIGACWRMYRHHLLRLQCLRKEYLPRWLQVTLIL